jgi:hypothetical protein
VAASPSLTFGQVGKALGLAWVGRCTLKPMETLVESADAPLESKNKLNWFQLLVRQRLSPC